MANPPNTCASAPPSQQQQQQQDPELITDILQRRLSVLGISTSPIAVVPPGEPPDVVFHVQASVNCPNIVRVLAHSCVLKRESDYFREIFQSELDRHEYAYGDELRSQSLHDAQAAEILSQPKVAEDAQQGNTSSQFDRSTEDDRHECAYDDGPRPQSLSSAQAKEILSQLEVAEDVQQRNSISQMDKSTGDGEFPLQDKAEENGDHAWMAVDKNQSELTQPVQSSLESKSSSPLPDIHRASLDEMPFICSPGNSRKSSLEAEDAITDKGKVGNTVSGTRTSSFSSQSDRKPSVSSSKGRQKSVRFSVLPAVVIPLANEQQVADHNAMTNVEAEGRITSLEYSVNPLVDPEYLDTLRLKYFARPLIKRRHTEVIVMEESEEKEKSSKVFVIRKLTWTASVLIGILEWLYLGVCHINVADLPGVYDAAYRAVMTGLMWCIRRHSMPEYLKLALHDFNYCQSLLKLSVIADCSELNSLRSFCEALQAVNGQPRIVMFETKDIKGRQGDFVGEGYYNLHGHPLCILKSSTWKDSSSMDTAQEEDQLYMREPAPFVTFARHLQNPSCLAVETYGFTERQNTWCIVVLGADQAGTMHSFLDFAASASFKSSSQKGKQQIKLPKNRETFKLQMITRFKVGSILVEALHKALPDGMTIREKRGSGSLIKGPSYCTSIVLKGDPYKILLAAKAIPYDMMGRSALKISCPTLRTFSDLFNATHTFGVDLSTKSIMFVKPLYVLIKVLEFMTRLNSDAFELPETERTFIELTEPTEPF